MKLIGKGFFILPLTFSVPFKKNYCFNNKTNYFSYTPSLGYIISIAIDNKHSEIEYAPIFYNIECKELIQSII